MWGNQALSHTFFPYRSHWTFDTQINHCRVEYRKSKHKAITAISQRQNPWSAMKDFYHYQERERKNKKPRLGKVGGGQHDTTSATGRTGSMLVIKTPIQKHLTCAIASGLATGKGSTPIYLPNYRKRSCSWASVVLCMQGTHTTDLQPHKIIYSTVILTMNLANQITDIWDTATGTHSYLGLH